MNKINEKDKDNLRGLITKTIDGMELHMPKGTRDLIPTFEPSLIDEIHSFIKKKISWIEDIYEKEDIIFFIVFLVKKKLLGSQYEFMRDKMAQLFEENASKIDEEEKKLKDEEGDDYELEITGIVNFDVVKRTDRSKNKLHYRDIANDIINELEDPTRCYALVQLPKVELQESIQVTDAISLEKNLEDFVMRPMPGDEDIQFPIENNRTYLLIEQVGCFMRFFKSNRSLVSKNIITKFKTFLGLSIINDIFNVPSGPSVKIDNDQKRDFSIGIFISPSSVISHGGIFKWLFNKHKNDIDFIQQVSSKLDLFYYDEISISEIYGSLLRSLYTPDYSTYNPFHLIVGKRKRPLHQFKRPEKNLELLNEKFEKTRKILNSTNDYAQRIKSASLWYLEGYAAENETFKFINYTIALESLLGARNEEGISLTENLSSRCGFWLGESLKEKEEIRKLFRKEIYETRSRIVHEGRTILKKQDSETLEKLESMTKNIINQAIMTS